MRVFVTGVAGLVGSAIAREALSAGWEVHGIDSMLAGEQDNVPAGVKWNVVRCEEPVLYRHLIAGADVVYHCAAAPYEGLSVFSPQVVYQNTLMSTVGVLRASAVAGVRRFIFCSSMSRYGAQGIPFTEDMPVAPEDPYAHAKVASENIVRNMCALHDMEYVIAVPHNIYGPGQRYYDPFRNVAGIMINRILLGRSPVVYGSGEQVRCLSYIDDCTGPLLKLATADVAGEVFNIGPDADEAITVNGLVNLIRFLLRKSPADCPVEYFPARPAEVFRAVCSAEKSKKRLGYSPRVELDKGLLKYIEWIRERGAREFEYHLDVEIQSDATPKTWTERLM